MKKKLVMIVLAVLVMMSFFGGGCSKKEDTSSKEETQTTEFLDDSAKEDQKELEKLMPDAREYFKSKDILEDSYINFEGDATKFYYVNGSWTTEEIESYKKAAIEAGFTDVNYEFDNSYAARTEDGRWYLSYSEDTEGSIPMFVIMCVRDHKVEE